jgi:hypothetical protein
MVRKTLMTRNQANTHTQPLTTYLWGYILTPSFINTPSHHGKGNHPQKREKEAKKG